MFHAYILLVCLPLVVASLYPTQPVQATVWPAGQPVLITWIDDGGYPTLDQTGPLDIWLWRDTHTCLVRLAKDVDPKAGATQVVVPANVLNPGSKYTLRFLSSEPTNTVVYSADFVILPANTSTCSDGAVGTGAVALVTQNGTMTTTSVPMSTMGKMPVGTPPPSGTVASNAPTQEHRAANAGRRGVDVEKLKFRFVFVIWPVLMGITMAL